MGYEPTTSLFSGRHPVTARARSTSRPRRHRRGATAIEYGLIVSLITLVVLGAAFQLYLSVQTMWNAIAAAMPT